MGGLCLILGNYFTLKGDVFKAIQVFLFADFFWLWLAVEAGNIVGIIVVSIGFLISLVVFWKMYHNKFFRTIHKNGERT